jgi:tRNA(Ile)-lysidine synthase TilS/MesJ
MRIKDTVRKFLLEQENERYMFFSNLEQIKRQCDLLLEMDENKVKEILENGHDWAQDHIATAKESIDQVFDFLMNELQTNFDVMSDESGVMEEGRKRGEIDEAKHKPTNPKLWSRAKSMAKSKFKVYPSAYANGWASKWYKSKGGGWKTVKK